MGSSGINAVHGEPKARGNPVAIREPGHGSLSWPSRERYVKVPCDRKVARRKVTRPGEADRRSKSRVICSGRRPTIPPNRSERRQGNGRVEKTPEPRGFCGVARAAGGPCKPGRTAQDSRASAYRTPHQVSKVN